MKVSLVVGQGPHKGRAISVTKSRYLIGRASECHLRPASQAISKRHCALLLRGDKFFVQDLNSTNGTFVNDEPVAGERELLDGDSLKVGPLDFVVQLMIPEVAAEQPTHVEKATHREIAPTAEVEEPPATVDSAVLDDETIGSMLLEDGDEEQATTSYGSEEDTGGSTIMEVLKPAKDYGPSAPYKPKDSRKEAVDANTSNAAKAILEKYRRRPRA